MNPFRRKPKDFGRQFVTQDDLIGVVQMVVASLDYEFVKHCERQKRQRVKIPDYLIALPEIFESEGERIGRSIILHEAVYRRAV